MNPTDKHNLVNDIYLSMQTSNTEEDVKHILSKYGVEISLTQSYSVAALKQIIRDSNDEIVLAIAKDLRLSVTEYTTKTKTIKSSKKEALNEIFISHAEEDKEIVSDFIQALQGMGISPEQIFCSSLEGYGTPLGRNLEDEVKTRLNNNVLVLFMLSDSFYKSHDCIIQMGAAWALTKDQISIAIPPFDLKNMKGVFQKYQGVQIDEETQLDLLKEQLESKLNIEPIRQIIWGRSRDLALKGIRSNLSKKKNK